MGKRRIRNLRYLDVGEIIGFDPRVDRRAEAERRYGISTVNDMEAGFAYDVDAVIISTPPDLHMQYAIEAAKRGINFFTEASVVDDGIDELRSLLGANPNIVGMPSCTMRYYFGPRKIIELDREGVVGRPLSFVYQSGQWLPDWHPWEDYRTFYVSKRLTGACREIVPFELTWLVQVFGAVTSAQAFTGKLSNLDADIEDIYQALFQFESGVAGFLQVDVLAQAPVRHFRLLGTEGNLEWDAACNEVRAYSVSTEEWVTYSLDSGTVEPDYTEWVAEEPYVDEMRDFIAAVREERPFGYTYEDDSVILSYLRAVEDSHITGRRVSTIDQQKQ